MSINKNTWIGLAIVAIGAFILFVNIKSVFAFPPQPQYPPIQKVDICHCPDGNPNNCNTLNIAVPGAIAHLANHENDYRGQCEVVVTPTPTDIPEEECEEGYHLSLYGNGYEYEEEECVPDVTPTPTATPSATPTPTETPRDSGNPPTFAGSSTNAPGTCPINDIGNVANIYVKESGQSGELLIQWSLPANADRVHIEYGLEKFAQHSLLNTPNDGNEIIRGLTSGKHYWFRVAGVRDCGVGQYSNWYDPIVP